MGLSLDVTEVSAASVGVIPTSFGLGIFGQARYLSAVLSRLEARRKRWGIAGVDWYAWQDGPGSDVRCSFCEGAGLFDRAGSPKPSWLAGWSALPIAPNPQTFAE